MAATNTTSITRAPKGAKPAQGDSNALDVAAKRALDVLTLNRAGKTLFEAEDDGDMTALKGLKQKGGAA